MVPGVRGVPGPKESFVLLVVGMTLKELLSCMSSDTRLFVPLMLQLPRMPMDMLSALVTDLSSLGPMVWTLSLQRCMVFLARLMVLVSRVRATFCNPWHCSTPLFMDT